MRFSINFEGGFFFFIITLMEEMSHIGDPGVSLFLEEHYRMKNLRARECAGEFLIFKHIESVISSFSGLEKAQYEEMMPDYLK